MRAVLQIVSRASVSVAGKVVGSIGPGIMALIGIRDDDTDEDRSWIVSKVCTGKYF